MHVLVGTFLAVGFLEVSVLPTAIGLSGTAYFATTYTLGLGLLLAVLALDRP